MPKAASNWVMAEVLGWLNQQQCALSELRVPPEGLADLIRIVAKGTISASMGRQVFARMAETGRAAADIVEAEGLAQVSDEAQLEQWVDEVLAAYPAEVERYRSGEQRLFGFFMGEVMKKSRGRADPKRASAILRGRLAPR